MTGLNKCGLIFNVSKTSIIIRMNQNFQRIFKIVCGLVVLVMFYFIYMVTTAYLVLEKLKPSHVTDLP